MSLTSLSANQRSHSFSSISSLDDFSAHYFTDYDGYDYSEQHVLSIEDLRCHLNSCFTCGVSWYLDHVSLDCSECGGYSLARPCVECDGKCKAIWKRDLTLSHTSGKARWRGNCELQSEKKEKISSNAVDSSATNNS